MSRMVDEFQPRPGQTEMASAVARTIETGGVLVVEAGTGIGKTYAYLVPALLSGTRVLVSTASKTLQDQLFARDLPRLLKVLGLPLRSALLKGRSSYLCLHRMEEARQNWEVTDATLLRSLARIETWSQATRSGDLAELPGLDERSPLIPLVSSNRDNCLGAQCPRLRSCHVNQARREALAADVVVINHHLFFADLAIREAGVAELLPTVQTLIFDEAHQLNETGVQFLGQQITTAQVLDFARDLLLAGQQHARGLCDWRTLASESERAARDLRLVVGQAPTGARLRWIDGAPEQLDRDEWRSALAELHAACSRALAALEGVSEAQPDLQRLAERASAFLDRLAFFAAPCAAESVRWVDVGTQLRLVESPLDIADTVRSRLTGAGDGATTQPALIFTSATLGAEASLRWFTEPCGLDQAEVLQVQSPFDYGLQAALYVPLHLSKPSDAAHSREVAEFVADAALKMGGRTLVLTTTLRALRAIGESLQRRFAGSGDLQVLLQGEQPKHQLMERFRRGQRDGGAGCVLVASASFWEGVDVPGEELQLLVIDKLPFPPPSDPLVEARCTRLEAQGRSVFNDYFVPEAAIALKQGAGRLIRRESDRGVLVVCDTRLVRMGYGRRLLAALPPMRRIGTEIEFDEALAALTRTSTTAAHSP